jgi:hypothetical protein
MPCPIPPLIVAIIKMDTRGVLLLLLLLLPVISLDCGKLVLPGASIVG